jgi:ribosomal protein L37AE/L43A
MLFECPDCKGKISRYYAELRVCQHCKKIVNLGDLLNLLKNLGVTEQNIRRIQDNLDYPRLFAA